MPRSRTTRPPADSGYPLDSDLHRMTDDGGPPAPDPARWSDPAWRDSPDAPPRPARFGGGRRGRWGLAAGAAVLAGSAAALAFAPRWAADGVAPWAAGAAVLAYAALLCAHRLARTPRPC